MLKTIDPVDKTEQEATQVLRDLLKKVPVVERLDVQHQPRPSAHGLYEADIVATMMIAGRPHKLICEVKSSGQPRFVRQAILQLLNATTYYKQSVTPVLIAPYLSPEVQALCRDENVGFIDFEGNARLVFDNVYIERQIAAKPVTEKRELRSLFRPKSAQVLRVLLRDPSLSWKVRGLAKEAGVSVGHASNVRASLLDREWAAKSKKGVSLTEPNALLDEWRDSYEPPIGEVLHLYTVLHGSQFEDAMKVFFEQSSLTHSAALASFSAAQWLAPYGRTGTHYVYTEQAQLDSLRLALKAEPASKGTNLTIIVLDDPGLLRDTVQPTIGIVCTSPVQTYLDLAAAGERGREAAEHLRKQRLIWQI
jgi:hypothetical protein